MLALPLLVTTLALAPTDATSRFEIAATGSFDYNAIAVLRSGESANGFDGTASAALDVFTRRVRDDDAPPSLQPYLQRAGVIHLEASGGGYTVSPPSDARSINPHSGSNGGFHVSASGYLRGYLYGFVGGGVHYATSGEQQPFGPPVTTSALTLPLDVGAGLRIFDARLSVGWTVTPTRVDGGDFHVPFWGELFLHGYDVIRRRAAVYGRVDLLDGGAYAAGGATVYLARRFGVGAVVRGSHQHPANVAAVDHAGGGVYFDAWTTPRIAAEVGCYFDWWQYSDFNGPFESDYVTVIDLTIRARPR